MNNWNEIRSAYANAMPMILAARKRGLRSRTDPYILDWTAMMTPIEYYAWQDIRTACIPLYPQIPVGSKFIDFGDPHFRIGVETDGAAYHDADTDEKRDRYMWESHGWRVFRIPGRETLPATEDRPERPNYYSKSEYLNELMKWSIRWSTGFFWCLRKFYYTKKRDVETEVAREVLCTHRLVEFPLSLDGDDE